MLLSFEVDGYKLLDGGMGDPIPVIRAINDGYDKIIVITTRHKEYQASPMKMLNLYNIKYKKYPNLVATLKNRHNKYNTTRDLMEELESSGKLLTIYPSEELIISRLERDLSVIDKVYNIGYQDGLNMISKVNKYIGGRDNVKKGR
jgi:predicted patatin/cPLA2 family phospholipase